jgi:hypothetical protein
METSGLPKFAIRLAGLVLSWMTVSPVLCPKYATQPPLVNVLSASETNGSSPDAV